MRRGRPLAALGLIVVSLALVGVADAFVAPAEVADPAPVVSTDSEAVSGRAVCVVGDAQSGTSAVVDAVRPGDEGDPPGTVDVRAIAAGDSRSLLSAQLFPRAGTRVTVEGGEHVATDVRWSGAPVSVARSWTLTGEEDLPAGTASGPCVPGTAATRWTVPGVSTAGGSEARLRLANPHGTGATVAVRFLTPEGPESPTRTRNISVGAEETVELVLNDYLPEEPDLSVIVEVLSGRVAVEGVQLTRREIGGIEGVSLLQAATDPAEVWTMPAVIDGEGRASWLWIANDSDRSAPVELTLHTEDGGTVPQGLAEVAVPPGTVRRVDLRGTFPEGTGTAAVTARSDGVPVTVSAVAQLADADADRTGFAVQLGAVADPVWTLTGTGREGRTEQVRLVNPGSEPATVDIAVWNGSNASTPPELSGLEVPAGALVVVVLDEALARAPWWALTVRTTSGEVVAGNLGTDVEGPAHLVITPGAPSAWWRTPRTPVLRSAPGTTQRLGTELGIEPLDPLGPAADPEADVAPVEPTVPGTDTVDGGTEDVGTDGDGTEDDADGTTG